ncbi:hypothetical protein K8R33_01785 [archaeon]|nr:hypothetical protein [archaeon]
MTNETQKPVERELGINPREDQYLGDRLVDLAVAFVKEQTQKNNLARENYTNAGEFYANRVYYGTRIGRIEFLPSPVVEIEREHSAWGTYWEAYILKIQSEKGLLSCSYPATQDTKFYESLVKFMEQGE